MRCDVCRIPIYDEFNQYPANVQGGIVTVCLDCDLFADTIDLESAECLDEWAEIV